MTTPSEWKVTNRLWNQAVEIGVWQFEPDEVLYPGSGAIMWIWCPTPFSRIVPELRDRLRDRLAAEGSTVAGAGRGQGNYVATKSTGAVTGTSREGEFETMLDRILDQVVERFGVWQEALNTCSDLFVQPA